MAAQGGDEGIEERVKSMVGQVEAESGILDRVVYKNKNQHRRCSYFQYLLKVRRDLKLLHSFHLEELIDSCFHLISKRKAKQQAYLLESLKRKRCDSGNYNFMERLQEAARLLSEMVEPILKAATEFSTLLARSFFMGFSLMVLALLARLRVLVQQILLDVVSVYNEVSSIAQKKQSIKLPQDGVEVFREYYPTMEEYVTLECVWRTDKFILVEKSDKVEIQHQDGSTGTEQSLRTCVKYRSLKGFLEDDEPHITKTDTNTDGQDSIFNGKRKRSESPEGSNMEQAQVRSVAEDRLEVMTVGQNITMGGIFEACSTTPNLPSSKPNSVSNKRVAFISVTNPAPSTSNAAATEAKEFKSEGPEDKEISLFSLFTEEDPRDSIF